MWIGTIQNVPPIGRDVWLWTSPSDCRKCHPSSYTWHFHRLSNSLLQYFNFFFSLFLHWVTFCPKIGFPVDTFYMATQWLCLKIHDPYKSFCQYTTPLQQIPPTSGSKLWMVFYRKVWYIVYKVLFFTW